MLVAERMDTAYQLSLVMAARQKVIRSDIDTIRELIEAEETSRARSETIASTETYQSAYRAGQRSAADNSSAVIELLDKALSSARARDAVGAADFLNQAAVFRSKKKEGKSGPSKSITALYNQYRAETDTGFHAWLKTNKHTEALVALGVASPKATRKHFPDKKRSVRFTDGTSNRPEDYE